MKRSFALACLLVTLATWLACAVLARPLSAGIAHRWGQAMVRAGDGKFSDAAVFLQHRIYEGAVLLTLALGLGVAGMGLGTVLARRMAPLWKWVPGSVITFVGVNLWTKLAIGTCLFWCLFWNGKGTTNNLTQFHIKLLLMQENPAATQVALGGSSQIHAQIDPRLLNRQIGSNIFTTELHFPGNRTFDYLFLDDKLGGRKADAIVCYVSESIFFNGAVSEGLPLFFGFRDLPAFLRLGGKPQWAPKTLGLGLLGDVLPIFWLRDPISQRVLGDAVAGLGQAELIASLTSNLEQRAVGAAAGFRSDAQSEFCFAAFEAFVARCQAEGRTVVLCCGQMNPVLARHLNPALRPKMLTFVAQLAAKYKNVVVVQESDLPAQTEADYQDLSHVTPAAQIRFTEAFGRILQGLGPALKQARNP